MLIQLPSGPAGRKGQKDEAGDGFEVALRRDLASAPIVSYDSMLGGWVKRALDLSITLLASPLWVPAIGIAAAWTRLKSPGPVFVGREGVTYAGRVFSHLTLRLPSAASEDAALEQIARRPGKWRSALERLPQLFSVIAGDMAIVGPRPLSRIELEPLKSARRYYLSMRPGVIGIHSVAEADTEEPAHYKIYALSWALSADAGAVWDALRARRSGVDLWRPGSSVLRDSGVDAARVAARRRRAPSS